MRRFSRGSLTCSIRMRTSLSLPLNKVNTELLSDQGFTLLEAIAVLVIIGIITAVGVGRFYTTDADLTSRTEVLKTHLRYTQARAMNSNAVWYIQFTTTSTYSLFKDGAAKQLIGEEGTIVTLPSGLSVSYGGSSIVSFDSMGRPCTDAAAQAQQTADRTLTVSSGSGSKSVTITKNTGFIP